MNHAKLTELGHNQNVDFDAIEKDISNERKLQKDMKIKENDADIAERVVDDGEIHNQGEDKCEAVLTNQQDRPEEGNESNNHVSTDEGPDDANMQALKFLYDVLSHFLLQYCKIVFEVTLLFFLCPHVERSGHIILPCLSVYPKFNVKKLNISMLLQNYPSHKTHVWYVSTCHFEHLMRVICQSWRSNFQA